MRENPTQARCYYGILGLPRDCTQEQIRSAYKRLALQLHPDKLVASGTLSEEEATANFQSLLNAYQVLSDPRERAFYDSHRSQILFAEPNSYSSSSSPFGAVHVDVADLCPFFSNSAYSSFSDTGKGFYRVYADVFDRIYAQELAFAKEMELGVDAVGQAPAMGNLESPYAQVSAFYNYWMGFSTVMDFTWVDPYRSSAGPTRKARRVMEDENRKARKKARKEFGETVRGLAEFVKKRDKRVIEMQMKRNLEEKRRAEEKKRKEEEARKSLEKARMYEEPEWTRVEESGEDDDEVVDNVFDEIDDGKKKKGEKEFYCVVCSKKFKSEKQWENHEQSKKHRDKVAELRDAYREEQEEENKDEEEEWEEATGDSKVDSCTGVGHDFQVDDKVDELSAEFKVRVAVQEEKTGSRSAKAEKKVHEEGTDSFGSDEEDDFLQAMVSGHRNRKKTNVWKPKPSSASSHHGDCDEDGDEVVPTEYNTQEDNQQSQASKKVVHSTSSTSSADILRVEVDEPNGMEVQVDQDNGVGVFTMQESSSQPEGETIINSADDKSLRKNTKANNQSVDQKFEGQKDNKSKNSSKGKKQKTVPKASGHFCETCGKTFESRNKLHNHLGATGHAVLKSR